VRERYKRHAGEASQPEQLDASQMQQQQNSTDEQIALIAQILARKKKVTFFRFCLNPESFAQSIENVFYVSFLVRDNLVLLEDSDEGLMLSFVGAPQRDQEARESWERVQMIATMDYEGWQGLIRKYDITEPMIPTRAEFTAHSGGWYS
jgi:hypothetical protein